MGKTSVWPTYSLLGVLLVMAVLFFYSINNTERMGELGIEDGNNASNSTINEDIDFANLTEDDWRLLYPKTQPLQIGEVVVSASVAKTWSEIIKGLSNTPFLPEFVVKLFVFGTVDYHPIWMKDMNYAIDIIWVDDNNKIVDIKKGVTPESFPEAFSPKVPARYVIETVSGFVDKNDIKIGDEVKSPG